MEGEHSGEDAVVSSIDVKLFSDHYWSEIIKKLKRGVLFLDADIYRVVHFNGGLGRLFSEGNILGLKEFSSFNYGAKNEKKGIFILSSPLMGLCADILKEIISGSSFEYVQIITTVSPSIHCPEDGENSHESGTRVLKDLEEQILEWMGDFSFTCEIFHYPLVLAPLSKDLFITPAFDGLSPLHFDYGLTENKEEGVFLWSSKLNAETKLSIRRFASFWMSFLGMYGVKPDIFTVGGLSSLIGDRLNLLLASKAPTNPNILESKVSILFLDRTLDLFSILREEGREEGTALDVILDNLPPYPRMKEDVSVDMSELFNSSEDFSLCPPGCLADQSSSELFDVLLKPLSESQGILRSRLNKASKGMKRKTAEDSRIANEFISAVQSLPALGESVDAQESKIIRDIQGTSVEKDTDGLSPFLSRFKLQNKEIHDNIELLQKSFALRNASVKYRAGLEKKALLSRIQGDLLKDLSSKYPENVFESLIQLVKTQSMMLSLRDILGLLIFTYSRIPVESIDKDPEATDELESLISDRLLQEAECGEEEFLDELGAHKIVKTFFSKCIRANGSTAASLRKAGLSREGSSYTELLLNEIYSDGLDEVPDLLYKSRGTLGGRLFKSGLSFLGLSVKDKKVHPRENPIIFIYVVGGITPKEIMKIRSVLKAKKAQAQFIIASNALLHSKSLLDEFLLPDAR